MARAITSVPLANWSNSNTPTGPFHRMVLAFMMMSARALAESGPMSKIMPPSVTSDTDLMVAGVDSENSAPDHVGGHRNVGLGSQLLGGVDQVVLAQGLADVVTGSGDEGVGDAATDDQLVSDLGEGLQHGQLGGDLGAADGRQPWGARASAWPCWGFQLTSQQGTSTGDRRELGHRRWNLR